MSVDEFRKSTKGGQPPGLSAALLALWLDARGDWEAAHGSAQADEGPDGAWVHAYLHRKEGDLGNASYWYRRAGQPVARCTLQEEWRQLAGRLLPSGDSVDGV
jgi:hypothetical protein